MEYKELEFVGDGSNKQGLRHWIDQNDYEWYTDMDCNFMGESFEEALNNLKKLEA